MVFPIWNGFSRRLQALPLFQDRYGRWRAAITCWPRSCWSPPAAWILPVLFDDLGYPKTMCFVSKHVQFIAILDDKMGKPILGSPSFSTPAVVTGCLCSHVQNGTFQPWLKFHYRGVQRVRSLEDEARITSRLSKPKLAFRVTHVCWNNAGITQQHTATTPSSGKCYSICYSFFLDI